MTPHPDFCLSSYDYVLPPELIAQYPAPRRDDARLLVSRGDEIVHARFADLPRFLRAGDLLVRNNTKVIPARLRGRRHGGGAVELLLTRPWESAAPANTVVYLALARPLKRLKVGEILTFGDGQLVGEIVDKFTGAGDDAKIGVAVAFAATDHVAFRERLEQCGEIPLPPYIDRAPEASDRERYQTLYAKIPGAVAAPTAGLHFTPAVENALAEMGVATTEVTLHVGPGTFQPLSVDNLRDHQMHAEYYEVSAGAGEIITAAKRAGRRVIAVGTTAARTVESVADASGAIVAGAGWTSLFITPGSRWRALDGLITNYHLPKSSLLVLLAALIGREKMLALYAEAVSQRYRFYSYGDGGLFFP
jgi:S-adenosylmethionine:tRNA ribosyltransferase-isomerase